VLRDIDLEVRSGELVALLGPSGCGKTTLLRIIAGLEAPDAGAVRVSGEDTAALAARERQVGFVFQHYALFRRMSVFDNVAFGLQVRPRRERPSQEAIRARVMELLRLVQLERFADHAPGQLSGGQQQRVALARALVNYPSALLLDEPLGALDLQLRQAMQMELKRIQREVGITFVHVTHDQEEALGMSDRMAVMNQGRVEQIGTPEEIYHSPATVFVAGFIGGANLLPATVVEVHGTTVAVALSAGARVDLPAGGWSARASDRVTVMVRPERLRFDAVPAGVALPAIVQAVAFQGPVMRCSLRTRDGTELVARVRPEQAVPGLRPGQELHISWDADAARLLPPAGDAS
ncbi:MAG: ABC transporter ATP-binding protein, partial [Gemmatimonadota bacterium]